MQTFRAVFKADKKQLKPSLAGWCITPVLSSTTTVTGENKMEKDIYKIRSFDTEEKADHIRAKYRITE